MEHATHVEHLPVHYSTRAEIAAEASRYDGEGKELDGGLVLVPLDHPRFGHTHIASVRREALDSLEHVTYDAELLTLTISGGDDRIGGRS